MQVTETLNSGLKREITVTVPAGDMEERLAKRLSDAKDKVRINGFRPGKVPMQHLRKMYGKSFMAEVVNEILNSSTRDILKDRGEKAAMQPEVSMTEDEKEADKILAGGADFEFKLAYEIVPSIDLQDISDIKVTRQVYDVPESEIEEQVRKVAESARTYEPKKGKAEAGDRVTIDFVGKVDGVEFEGGAASDQNLVLGSGQFIPGFEDQLVGAKAGDEKVLEVTFPADYQAANLAGKAASFAVTVKDVAAPAEIELNDEVAKSLGIDSLERLREIVRGQIESNFGTLTRQKVKRQLLDSLDERHKFEAPSKLVDAEFNNIWAQVNNELQSAGRTFADEDTTEEAAREEYMRLAERRVRLGLVLAEFGEKAAIQITDEEMQRALFEFVRRYPANQQQEVYEFYRKNPSALANLRAPLFEEKVVDHLMTQIGVTDIKVSKDELLAEDTEDGDAKPSKNAAKAGTAEEGGSKKKAASKKNATADE
ncbi:MAG: trigger factor [Rhizobiaceae bacterium]